MRCFIAISLPEPVLDALEYVQQQIPVGRVMPRENLHLTLTFLDELSDAEVEAVYAELLTIRTPQFSLEFAGLDLFGGARPKIMHAGVEPSNALMALHRKVRSAARAAAITLPRERYRPHVTLARFNRVPDPGASMRLEGFLQAYASPDLPGFEVQDFALFRSDLGRGPAVHTEMARFPVSES